MRAPALRALQGAFFAIGSPLGWLALRVLDGADPLLELVWRGGVYLYMLVGTVAAFAAFGWYVGRQEDRERESALHDATTGLYNTRYFQRRLAEELAFAARHARPLSLLVGDLDFFKRVNDAHGHATGDDVLAAVGGALMKIRRRGDTVARVGGEEFAVILPETDLAEATRVAERLRAAVAALPLAGKGGPLCVTMSVGAVAAPVGRSIGPELLFQEADAAMYRAKDAGRNCVVAAAAGLHVSVPPMAEAAAG